MGSFCRRSFASASIRFSPSGSFFPCADVLSSCRDFFGSHAPRGFPFSLPPFRREGRGVSGCPCVASRRSSFPPARLLSSERGGGASGRSFGARELASVSSVHSWTGAPRVSLLQRTPVTRSVPVGYPSSSLHALRGDGAGGSSGGLLCSRLPLPLDLCTTCEVMRRECLRSFAPVRVPPRLPDLWLGKPGRCFEPALSRMALVTGLVAHAVAPLSVHG